MKPVTPVLLRVAECESPVGGITLAVKDQRLCALGFTDRWEGLSVWVERRFGAVRWERATDDPAGMVERVRAYVDGDIAALDTVDVDPGGTPFQQKVWARLREMAPAGRTICYGDLAEAIGSPNASRAVGAANGANPICIAIPCHRVVGANGTLTGYGGGLPRKEWLLGHEGVRIPVPHQPGAALRLW
jgi:methylated-DNA-[protein]-cysteine S-methyltransferase